MVVGWADKNTTAKPINLVKIKFMGFKKDNMAKIVNLKTIEDSSGKLSVFEKIFDDEIKRVFFIYDFNCQERGGHRHKESTHALICQSGSCKVIINDGINKEIFILNNPKKCLIIEPQEWREMSEFSENTILLCISNRLFDADDYILEPYQKD